MRKLSSTVLILYHKVYTKTRVILHENRSISLCTFTRNKVYFLIDITRIKMYYKTIKNRVNQPMAAININNNNFLSEVMNSDKKVLLDFWAPWCTPCRIVVPMVEEIAKERPDIKVGKINVDENPELASQFGIMSIPTLVVMENGKIVGQAMGARPKNAILAML